MSLKAKIEAVIYASEEPVTLTQLTGLLGHEAQAELDQIESAQQTLSLQGPEAGSEDPAEAESHRAEALAEALHAAAAREAAHARAVHEHAVADAAAMRTGDTLDEQAAAPLEVASATEPLEASETPAEAVEKKVSREAKEDKEKARRLREYFRTILDQLISDYATGDRGLEIREVAGGYRL